VIVGPGRGQVQRDPVPVAGDGPLGALFAPVNRATSGYFAAAGDLVIDPSTERSSRFRPIIRSNAASTIRSRALRGRRWPSR
jgi:hypothetical protein